MEKTASRVMIICAARLDSRNIRKIFTYAPYGCAVLLHAAVIISLYPAPVLPLVNLDNP